MAGLSTNSPFGPKSNDPFSSPFGSSPFPSAPGANAAGAPKQNKNQIVTNLYRTILGRDPDSSALMYYISQPEINEDVVRKQMVESEEHKNILSEFKNIENLKKEIESVKNTASLKDKEIEDKQLELDELNKIVSHKTQEILRVKKELEEAQHTIPQQEKITPTNEVKIPIEKGFAKVFKDFLKKLRLVD